MTTQEKINIIFKLFDKKIYKDIGLSISKHYYRDGVKKYQLNMMIMKGSDFFCNAYFNLNKEPLKAINEFDDMIDNSIRNYLMTKHYNSIREMNIINKLSIKDCINKYWEY